MFTGIVTAIGRIGALEPGTEGEDTRLTIQAVEVLGDATLGCSIAVSGVCLTVTAMDDERTWFAADAMPQTLRLTTLGGLRVGDLVNLERALAASGRLDGHIVQGHVDGVATLLSRDPGPRWDELRFELPNHLLRYVAPQGSIALAGVSLTVTHVTDSGFGVALIPATLNATTLGQLAVGQSVNVEVDVLAKYVERMVNRPEATS
ncbi:MAG: riboflavin synthase [Promicromonosporaceae bacterium]|nr:riboflavin synthase [Promicromonosporaceae bacterium]